MTLVFEGIQRYKMEHSIDWSYVEVVNPCEYTTRIVTEAVFIGTTEDTLNRDSGNLPTDHMKIFL